MAANNVDIVLVIDASASMRPCIDQLRAHLRELIKPMQGHVGKVRFALVAVNVLSHKQVDGEVYNLETIAGGSQVSLQSLYNPANQQQELLTENADKVMARLGTIQAAGNEDNLWALDIAFDHPFGPVSTTKRIVALFSDEPFEGGARVSVNRSLIPQLIQKIHQRRIKLFCAVPFSDLAQELSQANGSEIEAVDGGQGLAAVDFRALLGQMGKSISISSIQGGLEETYQRALFGQDRMALTDDVDRNAGDRL